MKMSCSIAAIVMLIGIAVPGCAAEPGIRRAAVAGSFYPDDAKQLQTTVKTFLADAVQPKGERPIALVVPHAGYVFSGQIAADAYRQAMPYPVDVVVILGTNHTVPPFDGVSVYQGSGYETPLGIASIDQEIAGQLIAADKRFAFRPEAHEREHSEEVQVPFVQVAFPKAKIVTAVVGSPRGELTESFGRALARVLAKKNALIVASSDLSHYPAYADAVATDRSTLKAIASIDPAALTASISAADMKQRRNLVTTACGEAPIRVAMHAAKAMGARRGIVISYANSGDGAAGEQDRVVGYGAVMFTAGPGPADTRALDSPTTAPRGAALSESDRKALLKIARKTLESWLTTGIPPLPRSDAPALVVKRGAFVTLTKRGELRGCIGNMAASEPLAVTVSKMTIEAASHDPRFSPVRPEELPSIDLEISVLTPMKRVSGPEAVQVGRDGVLIEKGGHTAVFLPQVAAEQGWNRQQMLDALCEKARMSSDCWREGTTFYTFQADVFGERKRR